MANKLKVDELRSQLSQRGLDTSGTKPTLVQRLESAISEEAIKAKSSASEAVVKKRRRESENEDSDVPPKVESLEELGGMSLRELRQQAALRGISESGSKKKVLERLSDYLQEEHEHIAAQEVDGGAKEKLVKATKKGDAVLDQWLSDQVKAQYHVLQCMTRQWNSGKYDTIYLDLLFGAVIGSFFSTGPRYEAEFWDAFTKEFKERITRSFPDAQFSGFTVQAVIDYGKILRAAYKRCKDNPSELVNFDHYQRCFRKCPVCMNIPKFHNLEIRSGAKTNYKGSSSTSSRKRRSWTTTSENEGVSRLLADHVRNGRFNVKYLSRAMDYFHDEGSVRNKTWLLLSEIDQANFLNITFV